MEALAGKAAAQFLDQGLLGAAILILLACVVALWRGSNKTQEARITDLKAGTETLKSLDLQMTVNNLKLDSQDGRLREIEGRLRDMDDALRDLGRRR
ncbi:hypothetical protein GCM10007276_12450 [Agaricicola taiwanensis]|uniref:Uncharacterized protein n=1 Tax=Agaricicola taiwanensis TaxID=591372 RepID=A0A8J2VLJ3_9RHOB|nr:hypothetical protein [Agaricicola taiwanensis]GGE36460.1 hypothetical protein GCM10007276_12450 [Agaricicola taiwanensis]